MSFQSFMAVAQAYDNESLLPLHLDFELAVVENGNVHILEWMLASNQGTTFTANMLSARKTSGTHSTCGCFPYSTVFLIYSSTQYSSNITMHPFPRYCASLATPQHAPARSISTTFAPSKAVPLIGAASPPFVVTNSLSFSPRPRPNLTEVGPATVKLSGLPTTTLI